MEGLSEHPYKLDILIGGAHNLLAPAGLTAYRYVTRSGNVWLLVPELNFFPVVQQALSTGRREEYWNIRLEKPDPMIFELPVGVVPVQLDRPRGIVSRKQRP